MSESAQEASDLAKKAGKIVGFYTIKLGIDASCQIGDVLNAITLSQAGDRGLLEFARVTKLRSLPRAQLYLSHFISGAGTNQYISLADLLQDPGVRQICKMHFNTSNKHKHRSGQVITIGQAAYVDQDWKNSLGTYMIYYVEIGNRRNARGRETRHVRAWGENTYMWHPDDEKRITQCVHQAASRLERASERPIPMPNAAPFKIIAPDTILDTETCLPALNSAPPDAIAGYLRASVPTAPSYPMCRGR